MEEKNVKISLGTLILTIFVIIIAITLVIIATILVTNKMEGKQLEQNKKQNSTTVQEDTNKLKVDNSESNSTEKGSNIDQIFDFNNNNEYHQYIEINLNGKKKVIKLKVISTDYSDVEENYNYKIKTYIAINDSSYKEIYESISYFQDSFPRVEKIESNDGKDYFVIINNNAKGINEYMKIFDENCNLIGEIEYNGGATGFTVENDTKPNYELEINSIYVYNFFSQDEFALYKYTIENNKIVEKVIRTYQNNMESGTYIAGAS